MFACCVSKCNRDMQENKLQQVYKILYYDIVLRFELSMA